MSQHLDPALQREADRLGVATWYESQSGQRVDVDAATVRAVLAALQPATGPAPVLGTPPERAPVLGTPPERAPWPPDRPRAWGWQVQLYAMRSARSWGIGDFADLAELARWTGELGGDVLLCNPLHAVAPVPPLEPSPYYPSTRRFANPIYLRVEQVAGAAGRVEELAARARRLNGSELVDRDAVWQLKLAALERVWAAAGRSAELAEYRDREGEPLERFAVWCAFAERHGRDTRRWPAELRRPDAPADGDLRERAGFFAWLQMLCEEQLLAAQHAARMPIGVVHDLPVGVDPGGADAWAMPDLLAAGTTVGAPPDAFNQQGQDWRLPPWQPQQLAGTGYRAYRDMLHGTLRHAGGIRVDHVLGLFRLWWIPEGQPARRGAYVRYDHEALLGVLLREAADANAVVIGEDLGTVGPRVGEEIRRRGILGTSVLWFERDARGRVKPAARWRELCVASLSTHDLPTAVGFLRGEHVRVRAELGLLDDPAAERRQWRRQRDELTQLLRSEGLLSGRATPGEPELVLALHEFLTRTPCRMLLAAPADGVGDPRQPNLPGTVDEYPNWRLPVCDDTGRPVPLEEVMQHPQVLRIATVLRAGIADRPVPGLRRPVR